MSRFRYVIDDTGGDGGGTTDLPNIVAAYSNVHSNVPDIQIRYDGDGETQREMVTPFETQSPQSPESNASPQNQTSEPIWHELHELGIRESYY